MRCTIEIESSEKQVVFVDTPAFPDPGPDSNRPATGRDVTTMIQEWAEKT